MFSNSRLNTRRARSRQTVLRLSLAFAVLLPSLFWVPGIRPMHPEDIDSAESTEAPPGMYTNPLHVRATVDGPFESCADPSIIRGQQPGDPFWYVYCTDNPLNGNDRAASGRLNDRFIPILRSRDLVDWTYVGDAFSAPPSWFTGFSGLWAPDIQYFNGRYYLYFTVVGTLRSGRESVIGVATAPTPAGPWTDSGGPVIESQPAPNGVNARRWVFDSAVVADDTGRRYIFYGSFVGGISARLLSADGLHTDLTSDVPIASADRYEAVSVVKHGGSYYLFVSSGECCNGPLSGYGVFVGRATNALGPYTDREGVPLLASQVGGTPVLNANGNRWVGPGSNTVFTDNAGQDWMLYHAVDRTDPYFEHSSATKRPALLDRLDWISGWPVVNGGRGPSDTPQPAPVTQPGKVTIALTPAPQSDSSLMLDGSVAADFASLVAITDEQDPADFRAAWEWIRPPGDDAIAIVDGTLRFATQPGDLADHTASVLTLPTPVGDYIVETRMGLDVPPDGCCQDFVQAGLVIYRDDDNYLKLVQLSRDATRQIVFAKVAEPASPRAPRAGNAAVGPAASWIYLRIVKQTREEEETYTAYSSRDGATWQRGTSWTASLGSEARFGLVAMGGAGYTATFDYVRIASLRAP